MNIQKAGRSLSLLLLSAAFAGTVSSLSAADYSSLNGKCGAALKTAVKNLSERDLVTVSYGDKTWDAFLTTDVVTIQGRDAWRDMYSNNLVYVASGHGGMNIEHSVANSWWGGEKNDAYKDLYHLNPSDADANNRKNNNPLGEISDTPSWSNGLTNIGAPTAATGGGSPTVFEPADEYKGDFARAYFYIFTLYDDIAWQTAPAYMYDLTSYPTLKPWAVDMLLQWSADDPVDENERQRALAVEAVQGNTNPYVMLPGLEEYVWGDKKSVPYAYTEPVYAPNRPDAPVFSCAGADYDLAGVNTYSGRWWEAFTLEMTAPDCEIYYTLTSGDDYQLYDGSVEIGAAQQSGATLCVKAFARTRYQGRDYDSSVATLNLTARDPGEADYMRARWRRVRKTDDISEEGIYIITGSVTPRVMSCTAGKTSSSSFINAGGTVTPEDDQITILPEDAALVQLLPAGGTRWYLSVSDITLKPVGSLATSAARQMTIADAGTECSVSFYPAGEANIDFGDQLGTLQYNKTSPRFLNYTSNQEKVALYRLVEGGSTVTSPTVSDADATAEWYDLQGRKISIQNASKGIYIRVCGEKAEKFLVR